ncbi:MAG: hypothetical protein AABZ53_06265 [Planctomycetota bacterium]
MHAGSHWNRKSLAAAALALTAGAGVSLARPDDCDRYRLKMPDFDQKRTGVFSLPGGGNAYCAPSAASNLMAYAANFDFPDLFSGPRDWNDGDPQDYVASTALIGQMGSFMNTDPVGGTTGGYISGWKTFINQSYPDQFVVYQLGVSGGVGPTAKQIYDGAGWGYLQAFCYGRYSVWPAVGDYPARRVRDGGGHCVTINSIKNACGNFPTIGYRDPASPNSDTTTQSPFQSKIMPFKKWTTNWSADVPGPWIHATYLIMDLDTGDGIIRALDGLQIAYPMWGLIGKYTQGELKAQKLYDFNLGLTTPPASTHTAPSGQGTMTAGRLHPYLPRVGCVMPGPVGGQPSLWISNLADNSSWKIADLAETGALCFGPDGRAFVGQTGQLLRFDVGDSDHAAVAIPSLMRNARKAKAMASSDPLSDGDPTDYEVFILATDAANVMYIGQIESNDAGCSPYDDRPLPAVLQGGGAPTIAFDPTDGGVLVARQGVPNIYVFQRDTAGDWNIVRTIPTGETGTIANLQVSDTGAVIFTNAGEIRVLRQDAAGGAWAADTSSYWNGKADGDLFELPRSREGLIPYRGSVNDFNFDPTGEPGDSVPDCAGDFDGDGTVDFFDYDAFVQCFEGVACPPGNAARIMGDFDSDGSIDFFDYDAFVVAFERGC